MTVKELIEQLSSMPQDLPVLLHYKLQSGDDLMTLKTTDVVNELLTIIPVDDTYKLSDYGISGEKALVLSDCEIKFSNNESKC